jgi:hypothetical protein
MHDTRILRCLLFGGTPQPLFEIRLACRPAVAMSDQRFRSTSFQVRVMHLPPEHALSGNAVEWSRGVLETIVQRIVETISTFNARERAPL